MKRKSIEFAE